jgi:hypothetical protein
MGNVSTPLLFALVLVTASPAWAQTVLHCYPDAHSNWDGRAPGHPHPTSGLMLVSNTITFNVSASR